jgi:hypothetical protein
MWVLLTGMSGAGKSALVHELRRRGYAAYDADEDGFSEPRGDGRWGWRADRVADLLARAPDRLAFFAGCSEEQVDLPFDLRVLLTAPDPCSSSDCAPATATGATVPSCPRYSGISPTSSRFCAARRTWS